MALRLTEFFERLTSAAAATENFPRKNCEANHAEPNEFTEREFIAGF